MKMVVLIQLAYDSFGDADFDGVTDNVDECPTARETYNRFQDLMVVLIFLIINLTADSDGDGIGDYVDLCPNNQKHTMVLMTKTDVQTNLSLQQDSDQDGIVDISDACPFEPETYNFYQDHDGCPDSTGSVVPSYTFPDTDGDGIDDRKDACIDEQENFNGYLDWDGCPDVLAAESTEPTRLILTVMDILMESILVQQVLKLGTNTMIMTAVLILHQNNKDLFMMMILMTSLMMKICVL